jgi:hypothetical protein
MKCNFFGCNSKICTMSHRLCAKHWKEFNDISEKFKEPKKPKGDKSEYQSTKKMD